MPALPSRSSATAVSAKISRAPAGTVCTVPLTLSVTVSAAAEMVYSLRLPEKLTVLPTVCANWRGAAACSRNTACVLLAVSLEPEPQPLSPASNSIVIPSLDFAFITIPLLSDHCDNSRCIPRHDGMVQLKTKKPAVRTDGLHGQGGGLLCGGRGAGLAAGRFRRSRFGRAGLGRFGVGRFHRRAVERFAVHLQAGLGQLGGGFFADALDAFFQVGPILEIAALGAFVDNGFGLGRADALDAVERRHIGLVDFDLGQRERHRRDQGGDGQQ